jgi:predicted transglutaminase-like cysteine proteinase
MMLVMSRKSLTVEFASSEQGQDFGRKRRNRYVLRASSASALAAGVLLWSGAGAADLTEPFAEEAAPAGVEYIVDTPVETASPAPAVWTPPRSRLDQLIAEQADGAARDSAQAMAISPAATRAPVMKTPAAAAPAMLTLASNIQPAVVRRPSPPSGSFAPSADPNLFGSTALSIGRTSMDAKWRSVSRTPVNASAANEILVSARGQNEAEQLQKVNVWVNRHITFTDDAVSGSQDHWSNADESLRRGAGDCEDYAIAKLQVLRSLGVDERDLYLVLVRDLVRRADHAILVVRLDGRFLVLDSNTDRILPADSIQDYKPLMSFSAERSWIHGYREQRPVMLASTSTQQDAAFLGD